jgi:PBP1b-binding outer membrane lipoprotein LpoB
MTCKIALVVAILALSGCVSPKTAPPIDVALVPNDCRNQEAIVNWLSQQAAIPQQPLESYESYSQHRRQIRAKIWHIRYVCKPV